MEERRIPIMPSVQYKSLSEMITERLRESIIVGELAPGMRLTETDVAQSMGVSRVVVREAILMLIREGLLMKERNKFTSVVELNVEDIKEIFDLRIAIEQAAAKLCIGQSAIETGLRQRCTAIKKLSAHADVDSAEIMKADMAFHTYVVQSSCNSRMINVWEELYGPMLLLLYRYINTGIKLRLSHEEIIRGFERHDVNEVCNEIASHIEDTKIELISSAQQS